MEDPIGQEDQDQSKDEMRDDGIESPDVADAFMLTFAKEAYEQNTQTDDDALFDRHGIFGSVT